MHAAALLACLALASLALGALGLARVRKQRRGLRSFERTCLLDPLALPRARATSDDRATRSAAAFGETTAARLAQLISHPQMMRAGVEQAIPRFLRPHALALAALRFSGLSLLMANQQILTTAASSSACGAEASADAKQATPQPAYAYADYSDSDASADAFEDPREEDDASDEQDAQQALFDGLQFYTVLAQVGASAVRGAVQQAVRNAADDVARQRAQASIAAIEQRYPDILCLSAPGYAQRATTRADLASALLAVTAAAAIQTSSNQLHQQQQLACSSMQRRLSLKRPDALAFAADEAHEPMTRTPLTSPGAQPTPTQLETSFLQAA